MEDSTIRHIVVGMIILFILITGCQCSFRWDSRPAKADDLPPLYVDYFLPSIQNHPTSIGLPPDPIP